jgi:hypothetical protein
MLLLLLPDVPPEQLLAAVLMYRAIYEIIPMLIALGLWASFEGFARDGVMLRLLHRQRRTTAAARPTVDKQRVSETAAAFEGRLDAWRDSTSRRTHRRSSLRPRGTAGRAAVPRARDASGARTGTTDRQFPADRLGEQVQQ